MLNNIIDLSHHNTINSFSDAKLNGIVGVVHKATEGKEYVDAEYHARRQRALANGLFWGAYHFANKGNVERQVNHFLNTVNPAETDLLVLDFEPNGESGTMTVTEAEQFVTLVKEATGKYPGLYTGQAFIREKLGNRTDTVLSECFLWIARYSNQSPIVPPAWETFTFWQYTDGNAGPQPHQVPGIGRCDRNKFNGSINGLKRLWNVDLLHKFMFWRAGTETFSASGNTHFEEFVMSKMEEVCRAVPDVPLPVDFSNVVNSALGDFFTPVERCQQVVIEVLNRIGAAINPQYQPTGSDRQFIRANITATTTFTEGVGIIIQIVTA